MTTFDRREEAFENLFAHDEEIRFKAQSRRARLLATWAAGLRGKTATEAEAYAAEIVALTVNAGGDQALFDRMRADLADTVSDTEIREHMTTLLAEAVQYVRSA